MTHLIVLIHADPSMAARYRAALDKHVDLPPAVVHLAFVNAGAYSSAYVALAAKLTRLARQSGMQAALLHELVRYSKATRGLDHYDTVTLASYSAGYALVRAVLADAPSSERLDGVVGIDSWHSGLDPDGTARDSQLGGLVRFALQAKEGPKVCWIAHTDVQTPQTGPGAFASTTQVAAEVRRLTGLPGGGVDVSAGGLRVRAENRYTSDHNEHVAALCEWGAAWLADAVRVLLERRAELRAGERDDGVPTIPEDPLGMRALRRSRVEQANGVREIPGAAHNPRILEYLSGCMRGGKQLSLTTDETPWCAAAASWAAYTAVGLDETVPHGWRASVMELWLDALASGTARGAARIRRGEYELQVGDLAIMTRGGPAFGDGLDAFRATAGKGHVGRVYAVWSDGRYDTLDGNVGDTWTDQHRSVADVALVGAIAYPQLEPQVLVPTDDELEGLQWLEAARLMQVSDDVFHGRVGLDWAMKQLGLMAD